MLLSLRLLLRLLGLRRASLLLALLGLLLRMTALGLRHARVRGLILRRQRRQRTLPGHTLLLTVAGGAPRSALLGMSLRRDTLLRRGLRHTLRGRGRGLLLRYTLHGRALLRLRLALRGLAGDRSGCLGGGGGSAALGGGVGRRARSRRSRSIGLRSRGGTALRLGLGRRGLRLRVIVVVIPEGGGRVDTAAGAHIAGTGVGIRGRTVLRRYGRHRLGRGSRRGRCVASAVRGAASGTRAARPPAGARGGRTGRTLLRNSGHGAPRRAALSRARQGLADRRRGGGRRRRRRRRGSGTRAASAGVVARVPGRSREIDLEFTGQVELGLVVVRIVPVRTESLLLVHCASWCTATHLNGRTGYRRIDRV